jgi:hypothetical protein
MRLTVNYRLAADFTETAAVWAKNKRKILPKISSSTNNEIAKEKNNPARTARAVITSCINNLLEDAGNKSRLKAKTYVLDY